MATATHKRSPMKVLVAVDESPVSLRAARLAARLFGSGGDAEFFLINVATAPPPWVAGASFGLIGPFVPPAHWFDAEDPEEQLLEHRLLDTAAAAGMGGAEPIVRQGDPASQICEAADDLAVEVVVVGTHERSTLRRLMDRSTATGVLRHSSVPVLVVSERNVT